MRVHSPTSLGEACAALAHAGSDSARPQPIAGGTDVLVHWPVNLGAHDKTYLDLSRLSELRALRWADSHLQIGALATYWDVIRDERCQREFRLLVKAARTVGAIQIQARGTWAGNIANASPAADGVPALMACDASVVLASADGASVRRREVALDQFYLGYKKMRMETGELIEAIRVPRRSLQFHAFEKVGARRAQAITKVGVAITWTGNPGGWRVAANSVAPTVLRCRAVEALLESGAPVRSPLGLNAAVTQDVSPIDDIRSTAHYRRTVLARIIYFAVRGVAAGVR